MQRIDKPIRIVVKTDIWGVVTPIRFQAENDGEERFTIAVDKVLNYFDDREAGGSIRRFVCRSIVEDRVRQYELSMDLATTRWYISRW